MSDSDDDTGYVHGSWRLLAENEYVKVSYMDVSTGKTFQIKQKTAQPQAFNVTEENFTSDGKTTLTYKEGPLQFVIEVNNFNLKYKAISIAGLNGLSIEKGGEAGSNIDLELDAFSGRVNFPIKYGNDFWVFADLRADKDKDFPGADSFVTDGKYKYFKVDKKFLTI